MTRTCLIEFEYSRKTARSVSSEATKLDMKTVRDKHLKNAPIIEAIIDARMVFFEPPKADALRAFAETLSGEEMDHGLFREILE